MGIVAIFRQAKMGQRSSKKHLYQTQDLSNQDIRQNPNINKTNSLYTWDNESNQLKVENFQRFGGNEGIVKKIKSIEDNLDKLARADYKDFKEKLKEFTGNKRIKTDLQSKDLNREFIIAVGSNEKDSSGNDVRLTRQQQEAQLPDFDNRVIAGVDAVLKKKQLTMKDNLVSINIHRDEAGLIHAQVIYCDYSFKNHTTATQLDKGEKITQNENETKEDFIKRKKEGYKQHINDFGEYQTIVSEAMGLERGEKGSKRLNLATNEYKNQEQSKKNRLTEITTANIDNIYKQKKNSLAEINNQILDNELTLADIRISAKDLDKEKKLKEQELQNLKNQATRNKQLIEQNLAEGYKKNQEILIERLTESEIKIKKDLGGGITTTRGVMSDYKGFQALAERFNTPVESIIDTYEAGSKDLIKKEFKKNFLEAVKFMQNKINIQRQKQIIR